MERKSGAWVPVTPDGKELKYLSGPSEASSWRKLMGDLDGKGRTQLEEMGYTVRWINGASCREYDEAT